MTPFEPKLLRALPQARGLIVALALIGVGQAIATIATSFAVASLVVAVVRHEPFAAPAAWTGGLFAGRATLAALNERLAARAGAAVSSSLREQLVATWSLRGGGERTSAAGSLTLATQGVEAVESYIARYLPALVGAAVIPVIAIAALGVVDWPSAVIVALTLWLLPLFAALIGATTREDTDRRWEALAAVSGHFLDVMRGLPTLVSYGRAQQQVRTISAVSQRHRQATMRTLRLAFLSATALELLATISVALVAVVVGIRLTSGSMELLVGFTAILLAPEAYWPIRRVGAEFHAAADGARAVAAILAEIDTEEESPPARPHRTSTPEVRLAHLDYTYPGATRPTLQDVHLEAGPGLTVVTGPSGCGKTTLLEVIAGIRQPSRGALQAPEVHLVTQRPFLGAGSVRANLSLGGPRDATDLWRALHEVGLDGVIAALPAGLDAPLGDDGFGLSAGQRARLVLARALLAPAPVLLLDEPTAHIDAQTADEIGGLITRLAATRTIITVTHRHELLARATTHLVLPVPTLEAVATR